MPDWVGKTLGKVRIESLVARGGMAEVYLGTHDAFGEVAIKVMRGLVDRESDNFARFQREANVVTGLRHPNIVQMIDLDVVEETPYIVMEYVHGPTLAAYLKVLHEHKQQLPIGMVAHLLVSLASALDYAHSQGIVHRDVKPANVLLRSPSGPIDINKPLPPDVEPILADFGLVRLMDSTMHTTAGSVSGTPAYMSPEQARGEKVDFRSDIYSLGIVLYEMMAGEVPFQADTTFGMLMKHINEPLPPVRGISFELQALLDRTLAKDPSLRYPSAGEMANEFMAVFNGQTISPGTLQMADMARKVIDANRQKPQEERRSLRWARLAGEVVVLIVLFFVLIRYVLPGTNPLSEAIGRARFVDQNFIMDKLSFALNNLTPPPSGKHYEVWLLSDDGQDRRNADRITFDAAGLGQLLYNDPNAENILKQFSQIEITIEADDNADPSTPGEVVYSSVFPPQALVPVRRLLVAFDDATNQSSLIYGLWWSAEGVRISAVALSTAYQANDEAQVRKMNEEIINQIVGDGKIGQYKDWNGDGAVDLPEENLGDPYGLLPNGSKQGYIKDTLTSLDDLVKAPDATQNMLTQSAVVKTCIQNLDSWIPVLLNDALKLEATPFGPDMEPLISEIVTISTNLIEGNDANGNGVKDLVTGECGGNLAYEHAYYIADMPILSGPNRIPPTPASK